MNLATNWMAIAGALVLGSASALAQVKPEPAEKTVEVTAEVVDHAGQPLAGVGMAVGPHLELRTADVLSRPAARSDGKGRIRYAMPARVNPSPSADPVYGMFALAGHASLIAVVRGGAYYYGPWGASAIAPKAVDLGRIVLLPGGTLKGVVRGVGGRPLPRARIVVKDLRASGYYARYMSAYDRGRTYAGRALTDARGRFVLPCVFADGVSLSVSAPGYYDVDVPFVSQEKAIDVTMERSGFIEGTVRNAAGEPVDARIYPTFETASHRYGVVQAAQHRTKVDGSFRIGLHARGRYMLRVSTVVKPGQRSLSAQSGVWSGPQTDIDVELDGPEDDNPPLRLEVRSAVTGRPLAQARAVVLWQDPRYVNTLTLENSFAAKAVKASADGRMELPGPFGSQPMTGAILVKAEGHAPAIRKKLDYDPDEPPQLLFEMEKEAAVSGVVVDADSRAPLAGATVYVDRAGTRTNHAANYRYGVAFRRARDAGFTVDEKGRFRVGNLGAGNYEVIAQLPGRPESETHRLVLKKSESRPDLVIQMPRGVVFSGRLFLGRDDQGRGKPLALAGNWQVALGAASRNYYDQMRFSGISFSRGITTPGGLSGETSRLDAGGQFRFTGLGRGRTRLRLIAPPVGGRGRPVSIVLEPLRIRGKDLHREFDVSADLPGIIRGRVQVKGVPFAASRLFVMSVPTGQNSVAPTHFSFNASLFRCVAERDGSFAFRAKQGRHFICVMDGATSTVLYRHEEAVDVEAAHTAQVSIEIPLARVRVQLLPEKPDDPIVAGRLEWMTAYGGNPGGFGRSSNLYGVSLQGRRELLLRLPPVETRFAVFTYLNMVDRQGGHAYGSLVTAEITPVMGELSTVEIHVPAPAEVSQRGEDQQDAAKRARKAK